MNYNSIEEIFSAGISNMEVIVNNVKKDNDTISITGVSWFSFNDVVASTIYVSGNSWIGFGSSSEHLKVNRRDSAMYSLYREEGTLYNHYNFLKIRWSGYTHNSYISSSYKIEYDVILWDTGDISLHMISAPIISLSGTYTLTAASSFYPYPYTFNATSPDVTFAKTDDGFEVNNNIIQLELPVERRYLIRSNDNYYTVVNNALSAITVSKLTSSIFLTNGIEDIPNIALLSDLSNPEILYWSELDEELEEGLVIKGTPPLPKTLDYTPIDMTNHSGIERVESFVANDIKFIVSFDNGVTWKYYDGNAWVIATTNSEGMTASMLKSITPISWTEAITSTTINFRCILPNVDSTAASIYIKYR